MASLHTQPFSSVPHIQGVALYRQVVVPTQRQAGNANLCWEKALSSSVLCLLSVLHSGPEQPDALSPSMVDRQSVFSLQQSARILIFSQTQPHESFTLLI